MDQSNKAAYADGTRRNLRVQWESYLLFCFYFELVTLPASTRNLQLFAQFLSRTFKSVDSIKNYLNGVRSRAGTIRLSSDTIRIAIHAMRYDTYHDISTL